MRLLKRLHADRHLPGALGQTLLVLGLWLLLFATNPGRNETIDVSARLAVARQLWTTGSVVVEARPPGTETLWIEVAPGRYVAPYGVGQSLLFVPFDMASSALEKLSPEAWRGNLPWLPIGLGLLPLLGLGYWYALRSLLQEWGFAHPWPTLGALVMLLGTMIFFYAGQAQEETLVGLCVTLATIFALRLRRRAEWAPAAAAGFFAGACLLIRPVSVFALLVIPVLILSLKKSWAIRIRILAVAGLALAAVGSLALGYNWLRFGNAFTIGYDRMGHLSKFALDMRWPQTLFALLLGLGGGLLVLSPVLATAIAGMRRLWHRDRAYVLGMLLALIACYSFFSAWHDSHTGGSAWGTRYQVHLLALLAIPVTHGLQRLSETPRGRAFAVAVLALSLGVQGLSVFAAHHIEPFQTACDGAGETQLLTSPLEGQLGRRVENVARWAMGAGPPPLRSPGCSPVMSKMWDRYIPNFWGPVYAHRLDHGGNWVLLLWFAILGTSLLAIGLGVRRELRALQEPAGPPGEVI